jgi:hypothetical protein
VGHAGRHDRDGGEPRARVSPGLTPGVLGLFARSRH